MSEDSEALKRVEQNLQQLTKVLGGIRKQSTITLLGLPLYSIALGPDLAAGQKRGHARGILAIGDIATGVLAIGGLARGFFAMGGAAVGGIAFGGAALGVVACGGASLGLVAIGGGAVGFYAIGGGAWGVHLLSGIRQDPEMLELVKKLVPGLQ